jgi:ACS family tartrate transporter-like MFS transporter
MANPYSSPESSPVRTALDRARIKAYWRLLPLLFFSYMIAYVDRSNVAIATLTMKQDLPSFTNSVIGIGGGIFFIGYFLLEIPGTLIVERWSARKWICRIMITWGVMAALTAAVKAPWHFYAVRFLLGLAEAGFYPGVIVYLTHWFPTRDRARALAYFFVATPIAQIVSPKLSNFLLKIGTDETINGVVIHHPEVWGLEGWQWVYIAWGIPAVLLGVAVLALLTDRPGQAKWLEPDEREALEQELKREKALHGASHRHMTVLEALRHPKVLVLAAAYFFVVTGNYGIELFLPTILKSVYEISLDQVTWLVILPPIGSLVGQLAVGWSSDKTRERRLHASVPIYAGASALAAVVALLSAMDRPPVWLIVGLFILAMTGLKAYLPAFWSLPNLFLAESAAAGSIGLINSVGNLGGFIGPSVMGVVKDYTGSFRGGLTFLLSSMVVSATIILLLGLGKRAAKPDAHVDPLAEALAEPV